MSIFASDIDTVFFIPSENGHFILKAHEKVNRGFLFGDGIFETMIFHKGKIRFREQHIKRATDGCTTLHLETEVPSEIKKFESFISEKFGKEKTLRIRWNIYREGMGKYTPETNQAGQLWMVQKFHYLPPQPKEAYINENIMIPSLPWSNCKTLNAMPYVQAAIERKAHGAEEVVLLNQQGKVCEAGAANLFWTKKGKFFTPSLRSNCIAGVGRAVVLAELAQHGEYCTEGEFSPDELSAADQIFTTNVTGMHYIKKINSTGFSTKPIEFLENIFML
jgi:4-amino-4-deoxychorismate lyase